MEAEDEKGTENEGGTDPLAMLSKASDAELPNVLSEVTTLLNPATPQAPKISVLNSRLRRGSSKSSCKSCALSPQLKFSTVWLHSFRTIMNIMN